MHLERNCINLIQIEDFRHLDKAIIYLLGNSEKQCQELIQLDSKPCPQNHNVKESQPD